MQIQIKRTIKMLEIENIIHFIYNVELDSCKMGFKDFDINDEEKIIDSILFFFIKLRN